MSRPTLKEIGAALAENEARIRALEKERRLLYDQLEGAMLQHFKLVPNETVLIVPFGGAMEEVLFRSLDRGGQCLWSNSHNPPWIKVSRRKANGDWATRETNIYREWRHA